jgi:hypothetical protein
VQHYLTSDSGDSRLILDFVTRREFHRLGLYGEFFALLGVEDQITVVFTEPSSAVRAAISIDRDRVSFDEHDRRLMDALRPHIAVAHANAIRFSRASPSAIQPARGAQRRPSSGSRSASGRSSPSWPRAGPTRRSPSPWASAPARCASTSSTSCDDSPCRLARRPRPSTSRAIGPARHSPGRRRSRRYCAIPWAEPRRPMTAGSPERGTPATPGGSTMRTWAPSRSHLPPSRSRSSSA